MTNQSIKVAVSCLIEKDSKLLLGQRNRKNSGINGQYLPPSGHIENGETAEAAIHREIFEETNIKIKNLKQTSIEENIGKKGHSIIICFKAEYDSGEVLGSDDIINAEFFSKSELKKLEANNEIAKHISKKLIKEGWL